MLGLCEFTISSFTNQFWHKTIVTTSFKMFVHMLEVFKIQLLLGLKSLPWKSHDKAKSTLILAQN
jgi:hypothetical protein